MIKKNKWPLLISSAVILLPAVFGLIVWKSLPDQMATHIGLQGNADRWSAKPFAVFGLPLMLLAFHWLGILFTTMDPKNKNQNNKVFGMVLWIVPFLSLFFSAMIYAFAFGKEIRMETLISLFIGLMFTVIGNYMPKCRQNSTIGVRIKWTLESEENWNATHRMSGKLWVIGGLMMMACAFLPGFLMPWVLTIFLIVQTFAPVVYSYRYYKKQLKAGKAVITPLPKGRFLIPIAILLIILLALAPLLFTGDIHIQYGDTAFTLEASFWEDLTVSYDAIDQVEYRESDQVGSRTWGLGSLRLRSGSFENEEFGSYTRYTYVGCKACVVLTVEGKTLVINGVDPESTQAIYEALLARK